MSQGGAGGEAEPGLFETLNAQTARIPWQELQRPFASGAVFELQAGEDLVLVAKALAEDDAQTIAPLMDSGQLAAVDDQRAAEWFEDDVTVWAVVVAPYVLVQLPQ